MSAAKRTADDGPGYAEALEELETILEELEGDDLDVDLLAERVRRAGELIAWCRARIVRAEADVATVVAELEAADLGENPDGGDAPG